MSWKSSFCLWIFIILGGGGGHKHGDFYTFPTPVGVWLLVYYELGFLIESLAKD